MAEPTKPVAPVTNTFMIAPSHQFVGTPNQCSDCPAAGTLAAIALSSAIACGGSSNAAAARFSRRWFVEDVPGISRMLGERSRSQASATCIGVAFKDAATRSSPDDCNGVNPPHGKNGTYAMPFLAR